MADTAAAARPSPRPRPSATGPNLRLVPNRHNSGTLHPEMQDAAAPQATAEPENPGIQPSKLHAALTATIASSDWWKRMVKAGLAYYTPPSVLVDRPATVAELAEYAYWAPWTRAQAGTLRTAGIWWYRLVGVPATVTCRYWEWICQRPGRAIPTLITVKLIASTSWGGWLIDHLITPTASALTWALL